MHPETERLLREAGEEHGRATARRDAMIRRARSEGASLREIADVVGLSASGVKRVLDRG